MVIPWIMKLSWRKQIWKVEDLLFTVSVEMPFWGLGDHEPLIRAFFLSMVSRRNWKGPWTIRGSDWGRVTVRYFELKYKQEWEQPGTVKIEGKMLQFSEEGSERCGDILWKFLLGARAIPSVRESVVRKLLCQTP